MELKLAICGALLIDGSGANPVPDSVVLVGRDGRIVAAGAAQAVGAPDDAPRLDGHGMVVLPGLIDGHQHITLDKTLYAPRALGQWTEGPAEAEGRLVAGCHNALLALAAGVTTVRDCGAHDFSVLALRDRIARGAALGPRILACGRPITTTAGHFYQGWGADDAGELRKAVRLVASHGVDFVKIMLSGGTTSPGTNISQAQYSLVELQAAVDDAHRLGLPVAVHAISTDSIRLAAQAGVDTIEHCSWIGSDPRTTVPDEQAARRMVERGVRVDHAIAPRPYLFPDEGNPAPTAEEQWWLSMLRVRWPYLRTMRELGVTVFVGTDAAFGPWLGTDRWPGFQDMARALEVLVRCGGFMPLEVLHMATGAAARGLGLASEIGTLTPGKRADLLVLEANPLDDMRALRAPLFVFRDGMLAAERGRVVLAGAAQGGGLRGWELPA